MKSLLIIPLHGVTCHLRPVADSSHGTFGHRNPKSVAANEGSFAKECYLAFETNFYGLELKTKYIRRFLFGLDGIMYIKKSKIFTAIKLLIARLESK